MLESASLLGLICASGDSHLLHVRTGQLFERLWLTATSVGVSLHPMSQTMRHPELRAAVAELLPQRAGCRSTCSGWDSPPETMSGTHPAGGWRTCWSKTQLTASSSSPHSCGAILGPSPHRRVPYDNCSQGGKICHPPPHRRRFQAEYSNSGPLRQLDRRRVCGAVPGPVLRQSHTGHRAAAL